VIRKNITKSDISFSLSKKKGFSHLLSKKIVQDLIDTLMILIKDQNLILKNIGSFKIIYKNRRIGRNPKTLQTYSIPSRKVISFTPSKKLLKILN
tara:strand:+ start:127 stop:411 length:285 start_codon:yes stop_codon:yes gene_type:complete